MRDVIYTVGEAAKELGVHPAQVSRMLDSGKLKAAQIPVLGGRRGVSGASLQKVKLQRQQGIGVRPRRKAKADAA